MSDTDASIDEEVKALLASAEPDDSQKASLPETKTKISKDDSIYTHIIDDDGSEPSEDSELWY